MERVVDLLRISFQREQGIRPFPMVVRAVGRHSEFRELLCGYKVRERCLTRARPRTIRQVFVPLDVRKALVHSGNQLLATFCCHAIEDGQLGRKINMMGEGHRGRSGTLTSPERIMKASWMSNPFALKKSFRPCSPETTTTSCYIHERCAGVNETLMQSEQ
jgi:hypothetical protein